MARWLWRDLDGVWRRCGAADPFIAGGATHGPPGLVRTEAHSEPTKKDASDTAATHLRRLCDTPADPYRCVTAVLSGGVGSRADFHYADLLVS